MVAFVSAFARRKATRSQPGQVAQSTEAIGTSDQQSHDEIETSRPLRKKRKRGNPSNRTPPVPSPPVETLKAEDISSETDDGEIESSNTSNVEGIIADDVSTFCDQIPLEAPAQRLSTFSLAKSAILSDTDSAWTIRLHLSDNLAVLGQYDLWVRSGAVSICGAVIHASSKLHRVYAPSTHSIPTIKPISNPFGTGNPPCEISIISCGSRLRLLGQTAPKFVRIWNARNSPLVLKRSFVNMKNSADDPYMRPLRLMQPATDWQSTISRLSSGDYRDMAIMVCGPKGSGKSTFCRMLLNTLLTKIQITGRAAEYDFVAFLDLDPGQPEYSPPGELSLHKLRSYNFGPPLTHPTSNCSDEMVRAHHFGYSSPKEDPGLYRECALDLFSSYKALLERKRSCPLIINCSGWIQGNGLELITRLIDRFQLSEVIYMSTDGPVEVIDAVSEAVKRTHTHSHYLTSQASEIITRSAADLRMMQTLSYFHLDESEGSNLRWKAAPLNNIPPMVVHYAGPKQGIAAVMVLGDEQDPEFLESILEGCIVGIVAVDEDLIAYEELSEESNLPNGHENDMDINDGFFRDADMSDYCTTIGDFGSAKANASGAQNGPLTIRRNPTGIPYLSFRNHTTPPLPPPRSHSLGQALIRSIDTHTSSFYLTTPISTSTLKHHTQEKHQKIILVRGKLDTPTWAYAELLEFEKARRRRRERVLGEKEEYGPDDVRAWAGGQPWASVVEGGRSGSAKVRRVRRDLRYKNQGETSGG